MNLFELLPDEMISHVMTFCNRKELLNLTATCSTFRDLISSDTKLMSKFRLNLTFDREMEINEIMKVVKTRRFSALRILTKSLRDMTPDMILLLDILSETVEDLQLEYGLGDFLCRLIVEKFLPRIKRCSMIRVRHQNNNDTFNIQMPVIESETLEDLTFSPGHVDFIKIFARCNALKSFRFNTDGITRDQAEYVNELLSRQKGLQKLRIRFGYFTMQQEAPTYFVPDDWAHIGFQLESFEFIVRGTEYEAPAESFFQSQRSLKKVTLVLGHDPSPQFIGAVANLPKLQEIEMNVCVCGVLAGRTLPCDVLELSKYSQDFLSKVQPPWNFTVSYKPSILASIPASFESDIMDFVQKHSKHVQAVAIGDETWTGENCSVSLKFCEDLVRRCSDLTSIEVFNVKAFNETVACLLRCDNVKQFKLHGNSRDEKLYISYTRSR